MGTGKKFKEIFFDFFSLQILINNGDNLIDDAIHLATSFHFFSLTLTVDHLLDRNMWKVFLVLQIQTKDRRNIRYGKKSAIVSVVFFDTRMIETQELLLGFYIFLQFCQILMARMRQKTEQTLQFL